MRELKKKLLLLLFPEQGNESIKKPQVDFFLSHSTPVNLVGIEETAKDRDGSSSSLEQRFFGRCWQIAFFCLS